MDCHVEPLHTMPKYRGFAFAPPFPNPSPARGEGLIVANGLTWKSRVCAKTRGRCGNTHTAIGARIVGWGS